MERLKEISPLLLPKLSHFQQARGFAAADDCNVNVNENVAIERTNIHVLFT